ncbi:MAG: TAXI family TRAP transporter solute-binding subunit [Alphaproteobacteria bacterium]|nr:TAXI family TRAP transporter solute-binding subunit [Alphaproteobacteria bacterium]
MRKIAYLVAAAMVAMSMPANAQQYINILTGGTSGVYYPMGNAMSNLFAKAIPEAKVSVQATKASVENLNLLEAGRGELAFTLGDSLSQAWSGVEEAGYKAPLKKLRGVAGIYPNFIQIVSSQESGIKTLADLKGKRVSVGAPKSGTELNARAVFKAAGLSYDDMKVQYLAFGESVELMKNRQLDATLQSAGLGVASIRDLASSIAIHIVEIPPAVVAKTGDPAFISTVIPAKTYLGQDKDIPTVSINNFLVTHQGVSDAVVYAMTKAIFENLPDLKAAHSAGKDIRLENAAKAMPLPLHPGAEKYYREKGLIK